MLVCTQRPCCDQKCFPILEKVEAVFLRLKIISVDLNAVGICCIYVPVYVRFNPFVFVSFRIWRQEK